MKKQLSIALLFLACSLPCFAADIGEFSVNVAPRMLMPVGESSGYFKPGYGADLSVDYRPPVPGFLAARLGIDYEYMPIVTSDGLSVVSIVAGPALQFTPFADFVLSAYGTAGWYFGSIGGGSEASGSYFALKAGASAHYDLSDAFGIRLSGDYSYRPYLLSGVGFSIGGVIHPEGFKRAPVSIPGGNSIDLLESRSPGISGAELDVERISFNQVFPVLYSYYDSYPVGRVTLYNNEKSDITDISLSFYVDRFMDEPKQSPAIKQVEAGSSASFDIFALFSDNVLDITEGTKVAANVILKYRLDGNEISRKYTASMDMYDRNAITWDDDRKASAFVTAREPVVLELAKNVSGWIRSCSPSAIDENLCKAIGIHQSLGLYGLTYQIDPKTPFAEFSQSRLAVDFLQFPRQTLLYSSGDCDDLSILYSALLESLGIETAFITVPGHIYMAFALKMSPSAASRTFLNPDELIIRDEKAWVPVEITLVQEDFLTAWAEGAAEWRRYSQSGQAYFFPMHESWKEYKPVGLPGTATISMPDRDQLLESYGAELQSFIDREIFPRVQRFEEQISRSNNAPKHINRLGVLYARYGKNDRAEAEFLKALEQSEYVPSLINLGNLKYLADEAEYALEYYTRALDIEPDNPKIVASVARAGHRLGDYKLVDSSYALLLKLEPELAEEFAYLGGTANEAQRASDSSMMKENMLWIEE